MNKDFTIVTESSVVTFECIGDLYVKRNKQQDTESVIDNDIAERIYKDHINKARLVKMSKFVNMIIV